MQKIVDRERVLSLLYYYPESGEFRWRHGRGTAGRYALAGKVRKTDGYRAIGIDGRHYLAHRLAWLVMKGRWPKEYIDHINGDRLDNSILNLRECNASENCHNVTMKRNNTTGFPGVVFHKGRYSPMIQVRGERQWLGSFHTAEEAAAVYAEAKALLHPFAPIVRGCQ